MSQVLSRTLQFSPPGGELRAGIVGWLVSLHFFWKTALTIFLIFGLKLLLDKWKKVAEPDFEKKNSGWPEIRARRSVGNTIPGPVGR